jgi:hypothetical protein
MTSLNKKQEQVKVLVKVKRPRRFKAGSEMGTAVSLVTIDVEEEINGESENLQIQLTIDQSFDSEDSHSKN